MTILDTSVIVALLKRKPETLEKINALMNSNDRLATTVVTVYELRKGACLSSKRDYNLSVMEKIISNLEILELTSEACAEAAEIYSALRNDGKLIGEFDILIAATAIVRGEALFTMDKHFKSIRGLRLIDS